MGVKKSIAIILIIGFIIINISSFSYAAGSMAAKDIFTLGKNWIKYGKDRAQDGDMNISTDWTEFNDLAGILWGIGVFVAAIGGTVLGIKYMFASTEERANLKHNMIPYIIGTVIILGALGIWKFSVELLEGM